MIPALLPRVVSSLLYMGAWQGFAALADLLICLSPVIAAASFMAYALGQILMSMFNRLRQATVAAAGADCFNAVWHISDSYLCLFLSFHCVLA